MDSKRYYIVSDIHGRSVELLKESLKDNGFDFDNENHILVSLGDLFDRGEYSYDLLVFFVDLLRKNRAIVLYGNHEVMLKRAIDTDLKEYGSVLVYNGTTKTIYSFLGKIDPEFNEYLEFEDACYYQKLPEDLKKHFDKLKSFSLLNEYYSYLRPYLTLKDKYLLCHSGITSFLDEEEYEDKDLTLIEAETWADIGYYYDKNSYFRTHKKPIIPFKKHGFSKVIHGHIHSYEFDISHPLDIFESEDTIDLDSPFLINVLVIDEEGNYSYKKSNDNKRNEKLSKDLKKQADLILLNRKFKEGTAVKFIDDSQGNDGNYLVLQDRDYEYSEKLDKYILYLSLFSASKNLILKQVESDLLEEVSEEN